MAERVPNLFVVGAMRAGTTSLHQTLGEHPDIFMSAHKEPAFFTEPAQLKTDSRVASAAGFAGDRARYLGLFDDAGDAAYAGESSTHYTKLPRLTGVCGRMAAMSAEARILYLVRDPVERTLSHYRYAVRTKYERRRCLAALRGDPIYCAVSDYPTQIRPFIEQFGTERVLVLVLEELAHDPAAELGRLFEWLGVESPDRLDFPLRNEVAADVVRARGPDVLHRVGRSQSYQRIARTALPARFRRGLRRVLNRPVPADEVRHPDVLSYLHEIHDPQVHQLEVLAGRAFPFWATGD